ncbi:transketolase C-terminal domain-containing protein, partial [Corynebacterium glyciniphilum]|uniref:transketolase C-terminal domain-containing protein n=1 Tax=Corynebacterium glyciniphilum TaxID=1404244 RepID=UPI0026556035
YDVLVAPEETDLAVADSLKVLVVNYGPLTAQSAAAADALAAEGHAVTVVDPVWVTPVSPDVVELARNADLVVTVEDNGVHGGAGQMLARAASESSVSTPIRYLGVDQRFLAHGSRAEVLAEVGLDTESVVEQVRSWAANEIRRRAETTDVS